MTGDEPILRHLAQVPKEGVVICSPVLAELYAGAYREDDPSENLAQIEELISGMDFVLFDKRCAERFGRMKAALRRLGKKRTDFDLAIAATAVEHGFVLVTHDGRMRRQIVREAVPELVIEEWSA